MRRADREITDSKKIQMIIEDCYCCRLGFYDDGEIYIVPLNFGYENKEGVYTFYFHGAKEGRKAELVKRNAHVGFEMDTQYCLQENETACGHSAHYQSIIGNGKVTWVEDIGEKKKALQVIMKHNTGKGDWEFPDQMVERTGVIRLEVAKISCKEHR